MRPVVRWWRAAPARCSCSSSRWTAAKYLAAGSSPINRGRARSGRMPERVLVIAAHPDDELLGCGGTSALHARAGDAVTAVIVCEGELLRYGSAGVGQDGHTRQAAAVLGITDVRRLGFPDQRLDTVTLTDVITPLERIVQEQQPAIVYCQYGGD